MSWKIPSRVLPLAILLAVLSPAPRVRPEPAPRLLFLSLDGVPYRTVARLTDPAVGEERLFRRMRGPVPMISTFPSTTTLAFTGLFEPFNLRRPPGYEARFFDREENRVRGGGLWSYHRILFPWREVFDWRVSGIFAKGMVALRPVKASLRDVDRSLDAFLESEERVYFLHHGGTDLVGHLEGPAALDPVLRKLDRELEAARRRHPDDPFHLVLYSDHGQAGDGEAPLANARRGVVAALEAGGFRLSGHVHATRDVVVVPYGLVSGFVVFAHPERRVEVAELLGRAPGVDLCAAVDGDGFRVIGERGSAVVRRRGAREGGVWSYRVVDGDPLGLLPLLRRLGAEGDGAGSWLADATWLAETAGGEYPDPLYRIARGFELVANRASVICSLSEGYLFGAGRAYAASRVTTGRVRWTHGALERQASLGFLMSDVPGWRPEGAVRFDQALRPFAAGVEPFDERLVAP